MSDALWRKSAVETVALLRKGEVSPLELIDAAAERIAQVEPEVNALPTLCLDRLSKPSTRDLPRPPTLRSSLQSLRRRLE